MQYQPGADKVAMMGSPTISNRPLNLADDPLIQRPRKVLIIMISICLGLCLVNIILAIMDHVGNSRGSFQFSLPILSIVYYGFGLLVAYNYSNIGLRVFAWIGVVVLIFMGIGLGFVLIPIVTGLLFAGAALAVLSSLENKSLSNSTTTKSTVLTSTTDNSNVKAAVVGVSMVMLSFFLLYLGVFIFTLIMVTYAFRLARRINSKKNAVIIQQL